jgi:GDPmannose 4,6-dehydratase
MWLMLQQDQPDDYVIATGSTWSVQQFVDAAFGCVNLDWLDHVVIDPRFFRPAEVHLLLGDPSKARRCLGWEPTCSFHELVEEMVQADLTRLSESGDTELAAELSGRR